MHAADTILVVQMGCRHGSRSTAIADDLSLLDAFAGARPAVKFREVGVQRRNVPAVLQDNRVAVAALASAEDDLAVAGRLDRRTGRCAVIDALVRQHSLVHRMHASWIEARGYARTDSDRRTQERFLYIETVGCEIADFAIGIFETHRLVAAVVVDELRRHDVAVADFLAVLPDFLVDHRETVAGANIEHKIDVPGEYAGEIHDQCVRDPGGLRRQVQRRLDDTVGMRRAYLNRVGDDLQFEVVAAAADLHCLLFVEGPLQADDVAVVMQHRDAVARSQ